MKINSKANPIKILFACTIIFILCTFMISLPLTSFLIIFTIIRIFILVFLFYIYKFYKSECIDVKDGFVVLKNNNKIKKRIPLTDIRSFSCEEKIIERMVYSKESKLQVIKEKMKYYAINSKNGKKIILIKNLYDYNDIYSLCEFCINENNDIENLLGEIDN